MLTSNLILMHNEFDMIWHGDDEDWLSAHLDAGVDQNGQTYYQGDCYEYTPTDLVMTRCIPVGNLDISEFELSDSTPMPGDTVTVTAVLENAGLTTALGCDVRFYETNNCARGDLLYSIVSDEKITVNDSRRVNFRWTLPDTLEGVGVECVVSERNPRNDGYFEPVITEYTPLELSPDLSGEILSITQNGDVFEAEVSVTNSGNMPVGDGAEARMHLECLYGNAKEVYGIDDQTLAALDLSGLAPGEEQHDILTLNIPVSVFEYCGYDAVTLRVYSPENKELDHTDQFFLCLDEPMALLLGDGSDRMMKVGQSTELSLSYALSAFKDENTRVVFSTDDPSVAMIVNDSLTAVGVGTTTLTATVLPYGTVKLDGNTLQVLSETGKDVSITVWKEADTIVVDVKADGQRADVDVKVALPAAQDGQVLVIVQPDGTEEIVTKSVVIDGMVFAEIPAGVTVKTIDTAKTFADVADGAWYEDAVNFVSSHDLFRGTNKGFEPRLSMNRAMMATVLYRLEDAAATGTNPFADVPDGTGYTDAVTWANDAGIVLGTGSGFAPNEPITREQIAVMFFRYADYLGLDTEDRMTLTGFTDSDKVSSWAEDAMQWAISVGLFQGNADGTLNPKGNATRAEVAALLERMVTLIVK